MTPHPEWWRTFFSGLAAESVRRLPFPTDAEVEFILKAAEPSAGAKILDVPCGHGRHSLALAAKGFAVTGVDLCADLLEDGGRAAAENRLPARFEHRDMRDLPWRDEFEVAFSFGNSFAYLGDEGDAEFLSAVARSLKPGGRFVLNTHLVAESVFLTKLQRAWFPLGDLLFLVDTDYDPATARLTSSYMIIRDGQTEKKQAVYRVYTYRELVGMFGRAGFTDVQTFGSLEREPYRLGAPGLWLVGRKA
jgi:SAM-dependent methyltransferase